MVKSVYADVVSKSTYALPSVSDLAAKGLLVVVYRKRFCVAMVVPDVSLIMKISV